MENKIIEKFQLDGIQPLMMFYKDNLKNLAPKRFSFLKKYGRTTIYTLFYRSAVSANRIQHTKCAGKSRMYGTLQPGSNLLWSACFQ
jgi:hypothetical protein